MPTFQSFQDIEAWQNARELTKQIYRITNIGLFAKDFGLKDQIRRASASIMANIAEGFERNGRGEFLQFLAIAKGSTGELMSHIIVALDQEYITKDESARLMALATETSRKIGALMNYLQRSNFRGVKFRST